MEVLLGDMTLPWAGPRQAVHNTDTIAMRHDFGKLVVFCTGFEATERHKQVTRRAISLMAILLIALVGGAAVYAAWNWAQPSALPIVPDTLNDKLKDLPGGPAKSK
jgi:hypothetical protein